MITSNWWESLVNSFAAWARNKSVMMYLWACMYIRIWSDFFFFLEVYLTLLFSSPPPWSSPTHIHTLQSGVPSYPQIFRTNKIQSMSELALLSYFLFPWLTLWTVLFRSITWEGRLYQYLFPKENQKLRDKSSVSFFL